MVDALMDQPDSITYDPDDRCPLALSLGMGVQGVVLIAAPTVITISLFANAAGLGEADITWLVLAAVISGGLATILQAGRLGPIGGGHNLITSTTPSYVAIALLALNEAGPQTLATLVVVSSAFQFALALWLSRLHRIITPVVSGIVIMLISAGVMQVAVGRLEKAPEGAPALGGVFVAVVTLVASAALGLRARGVLRLWSPLVGIGTGCIAAVVFGLYDAAAVSEAAWVALPDPRLPGLDLAPGLEFWSLLPMFLIVSMAGAIKSMSGSVVIQQVSWRKPRVTDYRLVQGAVNANGLTSLLSGIAGTLPTGTANATAVSLTSFTGVASRRVGYTVGVMLLVLALLPKAMALLITVPGAVSIAYLSIIMGLLFVEGLRTVFQDGLQPHKALIVGVSLGVGFGLQGTNVVTDLIGGAWGTLLGNGLTMGTVSAILLTAIFELSGRKRTRLEVELHMDALPTIRGFLEQVATRTGWDADSVSRLHLVGEEVLSNLQEAREDQARSRLIITAQPSSGMIELQFMAVLEDENIEDRLAYLSEPGGTPEEDSISLCLLRHYASTVRHRKYRGVDIVTVEVAGPR